MEKLTDYVDIKRLVRVSLLVLLLPLMATILDENFTWGILDFALAFVLFVTAGASIQLTIKHPKTLYKFSAALVFMTIAILWTLIATQ